MRMVRELKKYKIEITPEYSKYRTVISLFDSSGFPTEIVYPSGARSIGVHSLPRLRGVFDKIISELEELVEEES